MARSIIARSGKAALCALSAAVALCLATAVIAPSAYAAGGGFELTQPVADTAALAKRIASGEISVEAAKTQVLAWVASGLLSQDAADAFLAPYAPEPEPAPNPEPKPEPTPAKPEDGASSESAEREQESAAKKQRDAELAQAKAEEKARAEQRAKMAKAESKKRRAAEKRAAKAKAAFNKKSARKAAEGHQPQQQGAQAPNSGTYSPKRHAVDLTTEKFVALISEPARAIAQEHGLYASVMIAQAILESDSGNSGLASAPYFNLFGIKGAWHGKSVTMATSEDDGTGRRYGINAAFRAYGSHADSLRDYAELLSSDFYAGAHRDSAKTPAEACDFLQGRYATATDYSHSLQDIIKTYDLTRFDEKLGYETASRYEMRKLDDEGKPVTDEKTGKPVMERRGMPDVIEAAIAQLGTDYVWGAQSPESGFDCSGLVWYSYRTALGIELPRVAEDMARAAKPVKFKDLQPGDLLFFAKDNGYVYHVALYLGNDCYLHSPDKGDVVKVTTMSEWTPSFAARAVDTAPCKDDESAQVLPEADFTPAPVEVVYVAPGEDLNAVIAAVRSAGTKVEGR